MRVLMICPELPREERPGSMAATARQFESLRALGLSIDAFDMRGVPLLKYLQAVPRIRRLAKHADLIHAHFGYCGWLGRLAPVFSRTRTPLVISFMGDDLLGTPYNAAGDLEWFSKFMVQANKVLARLAGQVIVKSQQMADVIKPVPSAVIPNGVDVDKFQPIDRQAARRELNFQPGRKLVLFPGDPDNPRKGFELASAAIEVATRRLGQPIELVPLWGVAPPQVAIYMNACDLMLMTSLIEGSPNVVKEAMACNLPIIGVPVGDVPEMLDGVTGCSVCERGPAAIGERVAAWLDQPGAVNGRDLLFRRGLDLASVAQRVIAVYEQAIGGPIPCLCEQQWNWQRDSHVPSVAGLTGYPSATRMPSAFMHRDGMANQQCEEDSADS